MRFIAVAKAASTRSLVTASNRVQGNSMNINILQCVCLLSCNPAATPRLRTASNRVQGNSIAIDSLGCRLLPVVNQLQRHVFAQLLIAYKAIALQSMR